MLVSFFFSTFGTRLLLPSFTHRAFPPSPPPCWKSYFASIFRVVAETSNSPCTRTAEELSVVTAREAMHAADTDRNGVLSWTEFKAWYDTGSDHAVASAKAQEGKT